jgi:hypothetical protein
MRFLSFLPLFFLFWTPALSQVDSLKGFRNAEWGMRIDAVRAASDVRLSSLRDTGDGSVRAKSEAYTRRSLDYRATYHFRSEDSTLTKVTVTPVRTDPPQVQYDLLYGALKERFGRKPDQSRSAGPAGEREASVWRFPRTTVTLTYRASAPGSPSPLTLTYARRDRPVTESR